ncbi:MAG: hypothetical protein CMQ20_08050 [Gammaproteobacteria bacterium]|jgi:general secretion pathway protein I|nr:hypothetical protein [Gammaproteobacteria bacterium]|tara:strand:- start:526 stop:951 length:426 start_codon:yes stop_codon:yes gene_type:complete
MSLPRLKRQNGFTLLETIVSLVIFSTSGIALYSLLNTNLITLGRVQDVSRQVVAVNNAIEMIASIDPERDQQGEFDTHGLVVSWQANLLEPKRQGQNPAGYRGIYQVGLYQVDFDIINQDQYLGSYQTRIVSYKQVRGTRE